MIYLRTHTISIGLIPISYNHPPRCPVSSTTKTKPPTHRLCRPNHGSPENPLSTLGPARHGLRQIRIQGAFSFQQSNFNLSYPASTPPTTTCLPLLGFSYPFVGRRTNERPTDLSFYPAIPRLDLHFLHCSTRNIHPRLWRYPLASPTLTAISVPRFITSPSSAVWWALKMLRQAHDTVVLSSVYEY